MWRILVVDDSFTNRQLILEILRGKAECDMAANGMEAMTAYKDSLNNKPYDLILLDVAMPEISGTEFLGQLREHEKTSGIDLGDGIPVIMVTAYDKPVIESFNKGCDDYILKPVDPDELLRKVEDKLGKVSSTNQEE